MIYEVWSDRPTFKRLRFRRGLNIVLATRSVPAIAEGVDATQNRRTRNGAGKSSLIDILRFVLGGEVRRDTTVVAAGPLREDTFFVTLDVQGQKVTAWRTPTKPARVMLDGEFQGWSVLPELDEKTGEVWMSRPHWVDQLGRAFFGLPPAAQLPSGVGLSFTSCIAYFIRRARDGAFDDWTRTFRRQAVADTIVPLSFLFGLDINVAMRFVRLAEARRRDQEVRKAIHQEVLTAIGTKGQVRTALIKAENRSRRLEARLSSASIVDFYGEYEQEAAGLDSKIRDLNDQNYLENQYLSDLQEASNEEAAPELPDLVRLYHEAGLVLPGVALKRYDEVREFHEAVLANRRAHLKAEIDAARARITDRSRQRDAIVTRHDEILGILRSGLSRGHYMKVDRELAEAQAEAAHLRRNYELIEKLESTQVDLKSQRVEAERALTADLTEREGIIRTAVATFIEISSALYDDPADFDIAPGETGPRFEITKADIGSDGVHQMQVFTFDLTIAVLLARRGTSPGFLVHDSHVFDGVDGRQIGAALAIGEKLMQEIGGQYIVTMNSDDLEKATREFGQDFSNYVVQPVLSDTNTGGLFGFRFEFGREDANADPSA